MSLKNEPPPGRWKLWYRRHKEERKGGAGDTGKTKTSVSAATTNVRLPYRRQNYLFQRVNWSVRAWLDGVLFKFVCFQLTYCWRAEHVIRQPWLIESNHNKTRSICIWEWPFVIATFSCSSRPAADNLALQHCRSHDYWLAGGKNMRTHMLFIFPWPLMPPVCRS